MSIHHATLNQLRIFDALARHMSVARTAEALHLTPPAISIQVKQLSETVGLPLLEHIGKQLYLTETGSLVAAAARDIFDRMERLDQDLAMLQGMKYGRVRLAIITTAEYFVPDLLGRFCSRHPDIEISLFVGNRDQLIERIKNNEDDLYILGTPPRSVPIVAEAFAENPLVVIAPPDHPLAKKKHIDPKKLRDEPFILREPGSGTRLTTLDFFRKHHVTPHVHMELGSNEAIKQCVMAGLGISIMSVNNLKQELANRRVCQLDVKGLPLKRNWFFVYLKDKSLSLAAQAFREFMLTESHELIQQPPKRRRAAASR
jgi:DNA-binding transcriptional LysR family regulator